MSTFQEKLKRSEEKAKYGEEKPKNDDVKPDLGPLKWLLVLWGFNSLRGFEGIFELQTDINDYLELPQAVYTWQVGYLQFDVILSFITIFAVVACCWGLWKWRKWAYYGLIMIIAKNMVMFILTPVLLKGNIGLGLAFAVASSIPLFLLIALMKNKTQHLQ